MVADALKTTGSGAVSGRYNVVAMARLCTLACLVVLPSFAADLTPDQLLLAQVRLQMARNLEQLPNYTCTQTIERSGRSGSSAKLRLVDVLRLEVAMVEGDELFAWPGSRNFEKRELRDMIGSGMTGNGQFGLFARALFLAHMARFTYAGEESAGGRQLKRWDYVVPHAVSNYRLRTYDEQKREVSGVVGYHGSIWSDASNREVVRFTVVADDIPPFLPYKSATLSVEYQPVKISEQVFLLPVRAEQELAEVNRASVNRISFSGCRQYSGESRLVFEEEEGSGGDAAAAPTESVKALALPPNVWLELQLESAIQIGRAVVGDPVTFKLRRPVQVPSGPKIPKGALVHGRLTYFRDRPFVFLGFELHEIEFPGYLGTLTANIVEASSPQGSRSRFRVYPPQAAKESFGTPTRTSLLAIQDNGLNTFLRTLTTLWRTTTAEAQESNGGSGK